MDCHLASRSKMLGTTGYSVIPAYSQILLRQRFNLRTVHNVTKRTRLLRVDSRSQSGFGPRSLPAYRYADRTVSSTGMRTSGAWRAVSEDSLNLKQLDNRVIRYFRRIAPPSFISRRIARISSMPL